MFKTLMTAGTMIFLLSLMQSIQAQKATEIYIPLGLSPGLSDKYTTSGTVKGMNTREQTISISNATGSYNLKIADKTWIWLDRSKLKLSNRKGTIEDISIGMKVEAKYQHNKPDNTIEWIKVQITK